MKKNIFIVILAILVAGLTGFITYDNFFKPETKVNTKTKEVIKEKTADERYKEYLSNLSKSIKKQYVDDSTEKNAYSASTKNTTRVEKEELSGAYTVEINNNLELIINSSSFNLDNYKISDNVLSYYIIHTGNGGFSSLYYITKDGKVYSANTEIAMYNGSTIQSKEVDVKNIVEIKEGASTAGFPLFVDIDGNIFTPNTSD